MNRRHFLSSGLAAATALSTPTLLLGQDTADGTAEKVKAIRDRIKPITKDELFLRQEKAHELMRSLGMDALIFEGGTTLKYFTGVSWGRSERLFCMVLPRDGEPEYVAPKFEESRAREQVGDSRLLTWEEHENPYDRVKQILSDHRVMTGILGVEETTRFLVTENIYRHVGSMTLVSGTPVTAGCRSVKSDHEIELMQIADDITREVFLMSVSALKEGMTEREFAGLISRNFGTFGVGGGALVLFGEASAHPHGLEKVHQLREGDIVLIDGGCSVEGYASDITRTTTFGKPSDKMRSVWEIVRKAQDSGLAAAKPGIPAEQVDAAARKVIVDAGYGPDYTYFTHRLGHGIGLEGHEWFYLVRGNTRPLQPGNTFSNEPGIYIIGEFGIRLEDEMLITPDGARLLLPQAKSLEEMF